MIGGHEPCGVVAAVGNSVSEKKAPLGERVMQHHYSGCGLWPDCSEGWSQLCMEGPIVYGSAATADTPAI